MATSVLMASDEATRRESEKNFGGLIEESRPENAKQRGRRKSKSNEAAQKKKQPQRGMGVEQLERLRMQERWKKMTETNPLQSLNHYFVPYSFPGSMPASVPAPFSKFGNYGAMNGMGQLGLNQALLLQRLGNGGFSGQVGGSGVGVVFPDQFQADPYGQGASIPTLQAGNVVETSKELSSMPNMKRYSDRCDVCHKKKRMNCENFGCYGVRESYANVSHTNGPSFLGFNLGNNQNINAENRDSGVRAPSLAGYAGGNVGQEEAQFVAVHRKGGSKGGSLFTEYEFFPGKGGRGASSKELELGSLEASVAVGGGEASRLTRTTIPTGFDASTSIDLSLKLSY